MIDHISFPVSDYERAKAFYAKALAPLDYVLVMEVTREQTGHDPAAGFGHGGLVEACMHRSLPRFGATRQVGPLEPMVAPDCRRNVNGRWTTRSHRRGR